MTNFLRTAVTAVRGEAPKLRLWVKEGRAAMEALEIDPVRRAQRQRGILRW